MMNLAMLIEANKKNTNDLNMLKELVKKLNTLQVLKANLDQNATMITGDRMYSTLLYSSNNDTLIKETAKLNNFAYFNLTNCKLALINYYNLTNSTIIFTTNNFNATLNAKKVNSYMVSAYNSLTKDKLNLDICANITESIEIPLSNLTNLNLTLYKNMKAEGIDILNPKDSIYHDRCISVIDNDTQSDTTINWRRDNYLNNTILQCIGINCEYNGITEDNYINCTCGIMTDSEVLNTSVNVFLSTISQINFEIIACPMAFAVSIA
jgi:hypothetical protein